MRDDLRPIIDHYNSQAYDQCLLEIDQALKKRMVKGKRAQLLMIKASCEEEMGRGDAARVTYTQITSEFARTSFADDAQRRLEGKDGNQREHLQMDVSVLGWQRGVMRWSAKSVLQSFYPVGEGPTRYTARLALQSMDRSEKLNSLADASARADAQYDLRGGTARRHLLERSANEEYWQIEVVTPRGKVNWVTLCRLTLTETRIHCAEFGFRKAGLTTNEKDTYLAYLKGAKLVGNK